MFKSCSVFRAAKKTRSAPPQSSRRHHDVAIATFFPTAKKNDLSPLSLSYLQTQQLPLLVSMVNEQQSSIFTANRNKFESITVTFVLPEKTQPQGKKGNNATSKSNKKDSPSSSSSSVTLKMRDQIEHFNNENNNNMNDDETAAESSSNRKVIRSLLLFHGTGGSTEKGTPNKDNFLEFSSFSTNANSTSNSKAKQQVISDRVFLTPSLNLAYDFASSSNQQKTVFAFQVDFFSKDALPVVSEYGPMSIAEEDNNDGRTKSRKNNNNNKNELVFLEDRYNSSSNEGSNKKATCYSYVHPDTYQPCFALLRDNTNTTNNNGDDSHQSLKTKMKTKKKTSGTNSETNSPSSSYRVRCVGFVDFNLNGKK